MSDAQTPLLDVDEPKDDTVELKEVLGDLQFVGCPRWSPSTGRLYVSDLVAGRVMSCAPDGRDQREEMRGAGCAGIGRSPDGTLMVSARFAHTFCI